MGTSYREDMNAVNPPLAEPDHELLRRIAGGNAEAFSELFRRRRGNVFRFAVHMTGSTQVGEDVVQDVFLIVMREAGRYDAGRASVPAWLCGIARNCVRQRCSNDRRYHPLPDENGADPEPVDARESPFDTIAREERRDLLRRAVQALPVVYREAVVLCDLQGVSYLDAAAALGSPVGTVRSRLHRARALLTEALTAQRSGDTPTEEPTTEREAAAVVSKGCLA
jgi:RNA polymerase sigma-70 factor (ECF subfamily)